MGRVYIPTRSRSDDHSRLSGLAVSILQKMRGRLGLFACLAVICGMGLTLPSDGNMPLIVRREIDRLMSENWTVRMKEAASSVDFVSCSNEPELDMTTVELIRSLGYPAEEHFVTTPDGYILALHRIPGPDGSPPVLLHHALMDSSFAYIANGKGRALAYLLADAGYDVWMGNVRGNTYSRNHTTYKPDDPEFWDFSWHEMGIYDAPTEINYITSLKNQSIFYIGHSMGTTLFFVMKSERPDVAAKVKAMFGLAPVAYTTNIRGSLRVVGNILRNAKKAANYDERSEFLPTGPGMQFISKCICSRPLLRDLCRTIVFTTTGFNTKNTNTSWYPFILAHTPAGTSTKTILHYSQGIDSKSFRYYDFGINTNKRIYNNETPPKYDLSKGDMPIELFWAENDFLSHPEDVMRLYKSLPKTVNLHKVEDPDFNHLDFIWGINAPELVNAKLLKLIEKYRHSNNILK